jgi:RNA methyltransferase, TrmH family
LITSRSNPRIKLYRSLRSQKGRREAGLFLVEGIRPVGEAVAAGADLEAIVYAPALLDSQFALDLVKAQSEKGCTCIPVSEDVILSLTEKDRPQGIIAVVRASRHSLEQIDPHQLPWLVALVSPQDPGNIGAVLRTIDAVGANGLILIDESAEAIHPSSVRASMGAIFWIPIVQCRFDEFIQWQSRQDFFLVGSSAHAAAGYDTVRSYPSRTILLLGSEREGLTPQQTAHCDLVVRLPMRGHATSLNLAVAAGVLLYDMLSKQE